MGERGRGGSERRPEMRGREGSSEEDCEGGGGVRERERDSRINVGRERPRRPSERKEKMC